MKELKLSTKAGKAIVDRVSRWEGEYLCQVYDRFSDAKRKAWDWCYDQYLASDDHQLFSICSHNSFSFSCGWFCKVNGEDVARYETSRNSYLVWLER